MIDVRLYAHLAPATGGRTGSKGRGSAGTDKGPAKHRQAEFQVEARTGLTVRDVVIEADVRPEDVHIVILNSRRVDLDAPLADGDRLGLFPAVSGG